jgi:hypothetical protein
MIIMIQYEVYNHQICGICEGTTRSEEGIHHIETQIISQFETFVQFGLFTVK